MAGLITQDPTHTKSSGTWTTHADTQYGQLLCFSTLLRAAADGTFNSEIFSKNCPWPIRIVDIVYYLRTLRTGGTPDHDIRIFAGDGAASEAFTAITDSLDIDGVTPDAPTRFGTLDDAETDIGLNKSLRAQLIVGGTTTTGAALVEVCVFAQRVKA